MSTTSREPDRLVLFTDAVVAIAITLLVLPLVDLVAEPRPDPSDVITENLPRILSFVLSFAVIARLWLAHHRTFQHVRSYTRPLVLWNMLWVFTVVILPFPTEMVGVYDTSRFTVIFYIGTILVSSLVQTVLVLLIHRNPDIQIEDDPLDRKYVVNAVTTTSLLAAALVLAAVIPHVSYYSLLLLLLTKPVSLLFAKSRSAHAGQ